MRDVETERDVLEEYRSSLGAPPQPRRKLFLLCPVGLVGSGKTTVLKPLAERLSLVRISGDEIRKRLRERGLDYEAVRDLANELIRGYLSAGYSVAIDSDCVSPRNREVIATCEKEYGALPIWIHVDTPEAYVLDRLKRLRSHWFFKDADEAIANRMRRKPLHERLDLPFFRTFDISRNDLQERIDEAAGAIAKLVETT